MLKLRIELVPETCWFKSLRKQMRRSQWDELRRQVCADQGNRCAICGISETLNCHEVWEYDSKRSVQRLLGFQAICNMCHHVAHFGRAQILADEGHLDLDAVIAHFMKVNGVGRAEFDTHEAWAFKIWRERSRRQWKTDLAEWADLVPGKPASESAE